MYTILIANDDDELKQKIKALCEGRVHFQESEPPPSTYCRISTTKGIYNIPLDEILFIESRQKKSTIHLSSGVLTLPIPLYRLRETLPASDFIQTHRSFIVNLKNIAYIDKTKDTWVIFFFSSDKTAFISRSYRRNVMVAIKPMLNCISD